MSCVSTTITTPDARLTSADASDDDLDDLDPEVGDSHACVGCVQFVCAVCAGSLCVGVCVVQCVCGGGEGAAATKGLVPVDLCGLGACASDGAALLLVTSSLLPPHLTNTLLMVLMPAWSAARQHRQQTLYNPFTFASHQHSPPQRTGPVCRHV